MRKRNTELETNTYNKSHSQALPRSKHQIILSIIWIFILVLVFLIIISNCSNLKQERFSIKLAYVREKTELLEFGSALENAYCGLQVNV